MYRSIEIYEKQLDKVKTKLTGNLLLAFTTTCAIGLPFSLWRWFDIGFQPIFAIHIVITVIAYLIMSLPQKRDYKRDLYVLTFLLTCMGIAGSLTFGLQSGAATFMTFGTFLFAILCGFRHAISFSLAWCLILGGIGYLFINGDLTYAVSPNIYASMPSSWITVIVGIFVSSMMCLVCGGLLYREMTQMLQTIAHQKDEIHFLAHHDELTKLPTKRFLDDFIERQLLVSQRNKQTCAFVFIDIDKFKSLNDKYGHEFGDHCLIYVANILKSSIRDIDFVSRLGGDEFFFVLPELASTNAKVVVQDVLQRIFSELKVPFSYKEVSIHLEISCGISFYPKQANTGEALKRKSDLAMYKAKLNSGNSFCFYE